MRTHCRHTSTFGVSQYKDQTELPIYGASRLGVYKKGQNVQYELTDHLGNVRAVVDKTDPTPSIFADYYPGEHGALKKCPVVIFSERASLSRWRMPNRNSLNGSYRYAYQGQEKDPETGKEAFQLRLYDSRINRWLTTDPAGQYSSPYVAMGNNWISQIDPDGAWHRDADGHLISDTGDTAASLATFLNTTRGHANEIISNEGFIFDNTSGNGFGFYGGQQAYLSDYNLTGSNALTRSNNFHFASILNENRVDVANHPLTQAMAAVLAAPLVIQGGSAIVISSLRTTAFNMGANLAAQSVGQLLITGTVKYDNYDKADILLSAVGGDIINVAKSAVNYSNGKIIYLGNGMSLTEFGINYLVGKNTGRIHGSFIKELEKAGIKGVEQEFLGAGSKTVLGGKSSYLKKYYD